MDWCRLTTNYYLDPALARAGEAAEVLFLRCIAYSGAVESHGRIPTALLPMLTPTKTKARLDALLRENLVLRDGADIVIRSLQIHQEALDSEAERRKKWRDKKAKQRCSSDCSAVASAPFRKRQGGHFQRARDVGRARVDCVRNRGPVPALTPALPKCAS